MKRAGWLGALALMAIGAIVFHEPLARFFTRAPESTQPSVASLAQAEGGVQMRKFQEGDFHAPSSIPLNLHLGDSLRSSRDGRARLNFASGHSLELQGESQITLEKQINGEALVVNLVRGSVTVLQEGQTGELLVLENGFLHEPGGRMPREPLRVHSGAPGSASAVLPAQPEGENENGAEIEKGGSLSTEYIVSIIQGQKAFFNRCYAAHLQQSPYSKGSMNFSFVVEPTGRVTDVKLLSSTLPDEVLQKCVATVIERCRFRAFDSKPIIANYPILFE